MRSLGNALWDLHIERAEGVCGGAANAADRDVFAAKHSVPKGRSRGLSWGPSQGAVKAQSGRSRHGRNV